MTRHFNPAKNIFDDYEDEDDGTAIVCDRCGQAVYWGDHYSADGAQRRVLFSSTSKRKHVCSLDDSAFGVVPE